MAIYAPGLRDRHNRRRNKAGRSVVAMLSLTAMVDMFTVLVIFLLQSYKTDSGLLEINDDVPLPMASAVKELKPANVVLISREKGIQINKAVVAEFKVVKEQVDWLIPNLQTRLQQEFQAAQEKRKVLALSAIKSAVDSNRERNEKEQELDDRRVTVQADKSIDFLTLKKVMWTVTEAGASEINFAVIKDESTQVE